MVNTTKASDQYDTKLFSYAWYENLGRFIEKIFFLTYIPTKKSEKIPYPHENYSEIKEIK